MQCQKLKTYMETGRVVFLPARSIRPNPSQPRKVFRPEALEELSRSIASHGILQPLSVRRSGLGYELIAGERRLRQSLCKAADASSNPESGVLDGTPHPHGSILRAKAQCVEHCANAQYQLRRAQLPGGIVQPVSAAAIPPVAAQQMDALELRPKRAQLCAEAGVPRRSGWLVLPRFSCFIFQQKGCSFLYLQEILICLFSLLSTRCRIRTAFLTRITLFIIHPATKKS